MPGDKRLLERMLFCNRGGWGGSVKRLPECWPVRVAVFVADINLDGPKKIPFNIRKMGGTAQVIKLDVTKVQEVTEMVKDVLIQWGRVDILVNNVGGFNQFPSILETKEGEWDRVIDLNLKSVFLCCLAVV
jgi:3-oxoacyl-[acyl-carrier protein] reductase